MISKAELINQSYSGQYKEKIYDIPSPWNSQDWTWVKFENDDFDEWCGEFRGSQDIELKGLFLFNQNLHAISCFASKSTIINLMVHH